MSHFDREKFIPDLFDRPVENSNYKDLSLNLYKPEDPEMFRNKRNIFIYLFIEKVSLRKKYIFMGWCQGSKYK